jgi:methylthioribose-1-phosphate isomerase
MRARKRLLHREKFFYACGGGQTTDETLVPIEWQAQGKVRFLDQTLLPHEEVWVETSDYRVIAEAIRRLQVRGAPLIGIAAAYGLALSAAAGGEDIEIAAAELRGTRPTAVNLAWALDRCLRAVDGVSDAQEIRRRLAQEAVAIHQEDIAANRRIGAYGATLLREQSTVLTHCNAGALATGGYGTALGVIRSAALEHRLRLVFADETRPLLQGARLTAWELARDAIPCTIIVDSAAGSYLRRGEIDAVITGADRIAANGDVANKIGTYQLAVLARENGVPFYVAAPTSTIDLSLASGDEIPIEQRSPDEVTSLRSQRLAPDEAAVQAENPAFDVTPNAYVTAIITENGVAKAPYLDSLRSVSSAEVPVRG